MRMHIPCPQCAVRCVGLRGIANHWDRSISCKNICQREMAAGRLNLTEFAIEHQRPSVMDPIDLSGEFVPDAMDSDDDLMEHPMWPDNDEDVEELNPFDFDADDDDISLGMVPEYRNNGDLLRFNPDVFLDHNDGAFTSAEILSITLLKFLGSIRAPLYAYDTIMEIIGQAISLGGELPMSFPKRRTFIQYLFGRFELKGILPRTITIPTNGAHPKPFCDVVVHDALSMIHSLLRDPRLMQDDNLLFPDPTNPLAAPDGDPEWIADIDTGRAYKEAHTAMCTKPGDLLCPIIFYMDKLHTDKHSHLTLEPPLFHFRLVN